MNKKKKKESKEVKHLTNLIYTASNFINQARRHKNKLSINDDSFEFKKQKLESEDVFHTAFNRLVMALGDYSDFKKEEEEVSE